MNTGISFEQQALIHENLEMLNSYSTEELLRINESDWGYTDSGNDWYTVCSLGSMQSPIAIETGCIIKLVGVGGNMYPFRFTYPLCSNAGSFTDKSYQIQYNDGFVDMLGLNGETRRYESQKVEIHAPAEHIIKGRQKALELHVVHKERNTGNLLVFAVLFKVSSHHNSVIQDLIDDEEFDLQVLVGDRPELYAYVGSLTYPPCTESVLWVVNATTQKVSFEQVKFFSSKWENCQSFAKGHGNNRAVQLLNNRVVFNFV